MLRVYMRAPYECVCFENAVPACAENTENDGRECENVSETVMCRLRKEKRTEWSHDRDRRRNEEKNV